MLTELTDNIKSLSNIYMASKFLFLHCNNEPADMKVLDVLGSVLVFRETYQNKSFTEIYTKYDVIVLDVNDAKNKSWYASYKAAINAAPHIKTIFLHHAHTHIEEKLMKSLKDDWRVDSVIKELPKLWNDRDDLINKLINNIHLASLDLPAAESCFKSFLHAVAEKVNCSNN